MLTTYRSVLATPGAALFSVSGLFARLPLSMTALGIVLLVHERTGSFAQAGTLTAVYVLTASVGGPLQGRLADRLGQAPVLWVAGGLHGVAMIVFLLVADRSAPVPHLALVAAGLGATQAGSLVRTRWAHLLQDREKLNTARPSEQLNTARPGEQLNTAFALEAVLDEVVFVVGPVLVTFLTLQVAPVSGLAFATAAYVLASWALALQRGTAPPVTDRSTSPVAPMGWSLLVPLMACGVALGVLFGSTEVIVVAFTEEAGRPGLAGAVLAAWAAGSLVAGLVVGTLPAGNALVRLRWTLVAMTVLFVPLPFVDALAVLALGMVATGLMIAPSLIALTRLVQVGVPSTRFTEATGWIGTGLAAGVALGAAVAGHGADAWGASATFTVPLAAIFVAAAVAWTAVRPAGIRWSAP